MSAEGSRARAGPEERAAELRGRLRDILFADPWFVDLLRAARTVDAPDWVIGAGVIRDVVWDALHGKPRGLVKDVDLAFFDPADLRPENDAAVERALALAMPGVRWDAKNQAAVHLWYERRFGHAIPPITGIADGIARWPETATAIGVRLEESDDLTVVAPCGLDDLFELVLRRNPRQVSRAYFEERLARKDISGRWPRVRVVREPAS
jgi:hypothetical protein